MELLRNSWNSADYLALLEDLKSNGEEKIAAFNKKLIPGIQTPVLGLRVPGLRKMGAQIAKGDYNGFLSQPNTKIYEETLLRGFVVGSIKQPLSGVLPYVERHVPDIDNWALCDTFCSSIKQAKKDLPGYFAFLDPYYQSGDPWMIRFALISYLSFFVTGDYIGELFKRAEGVTHPHYYVMMGNAWLLSVCYVKFPELTLGFLKQTKLDDITYNKTIQKIIESKRVSPAEKDYLRTMKRK